MQIRQNVYICSCGFNVNLLPKAPKLMQIETEQPIRISIWFTTLKHTSLSPRSLPKSSDCDSSNSCSKIHESSFIQCLLWRFKCYSKEKMLKIINLEQITIPDKKKEECDDDQRNHCQKTHDTICIKYRFITTKQARM